MDAKDDRYEKQRQAAQRQRERQQAKMADPAYRQAQQEKRQASAKRTFEKQLEKRRSPEYQAQQRERARAATVKRQSKPKSTAVAVPAKPRKPATRGLKGRTPTAAERRVMDAIGRLPCIACLLHGHEQPLISLHHIDGREKPDAHMLVLPLCAWHHQDAAPKEVRELYPWLVPVHASGSLGGKKAFGALNASEDELLLQAYARAGIEREVNFSNEISGRNFAPQELREVRQ